MERPIIFNTEMVRAILDDRKTHTRRPLKDWRTIRMRRTVYSDLPSLDRQKAAEGQEYLFTLNRCGAVAAVTPTGLLGVKPGEFDFVLPWFKGRTYLVEKGWNITPEECEIPFAGSGEILGTLKPLGVRLVRLQNITEEEAKLEGVQPALCLPGDRFSYVAGFGQLWESIYHDTKNAWDANPWVWDIGFWRVP